MMASASVKPDLGLTAHNRRRMCHSHRALPLTLSLSPWERGRPNNGCGRTPSPIRIRLRRRILERQARQNELAGRGRGVRGNARCAEH